MCPDEDISNIGELVKFYASMSLAPNTLSTYKSAENNFWFFCLYYKLDMVPASDLTLASFMAHMAQTMAYNSLKVQWSAIGELHRRNGCEWNTLSSRRLVFQVMRGIKRTHGSSSTKKHAIQPEELCAMYHHLDMNNPFDVVWWAAALTAFFLMLRKDNVTVAKADAFNFNSNLSRGDFAMEPSSTQSAAMWVSIRHSKTNQFSEYVHYVPLIPIAGSYMCPVNAVTRALAVAKHKKLKDPAFCYPSPPKSSNYVALTHPTFVTKLKSLASKVGLNPDKVSGHSFRRGGATFAFGLTQNHSLIKICGGLA